MQKNHKHYKCRHKHSWRFNQQQCGFTMVELLVAMAIGLFLVGGVFQLFVANKQSSRIQNNLSHVQENGRFAVSELARVIRMTGLKSDPTDTAAFSTVATAPIVGTDSTSDDISISFQGSIGGAIDCLGTSFLPATPAATITNRFYLANDANGVSSLFCSETTAATPNPQPLVEDVTNMQITYGVDTAGDGTANYYVDATTVTAGTAGVADWPNVVSVHISLLVDSSEDNVTTAAQNYQFEGATVTPTDTRLHKVFNITIALRNRLIV